MWAGEVTVLEETRTIGEGAFYDCEAITAVHLPSKLSTISDYAFGKSPITELTLPQTLFSIRYCAFYTSCIEHLDIPASVEILPGYSCYSMEMLHSVVMRGVKVIE